MQPSHDVALLTIDKRVPLSSKISPICLPDTSRSRLKIERSVIAGWGATSSESQKGVEKLRYGEVELVGRKDCQERYDRWGQGGRVRIGKGLICAGGRRVDSCAGDSGAPLMVQQGPANTWTLAGLVSFGPAKCGSGVPGVYVKVNQYLHWINEAINRN